MDEPNSTATPLSVVISVNDASHDTNSSPPVRPSMDIHEYQAARKIDLHSELKEDHVKGCLPWVQYRLHIPFRPLNIPHNEAAILWDSFAHIFHKREKEKFHKHKHSPSQDQTTQQPPSILIRILALLGLFFITFGPSTGYASVGALSDFIKTEYDVNDSQIGLLFSVYSLLNIFSVFFAGLLVDKWGPNKSCVLFTIIIWIGNLLPLLKLFTPSSAHFPSLMVGRIVYGVGTECMGIVQSALLARWYSHDRTITLSLSNSITLMSFRFSGLIALVVFPALAEIKFDLALGMIAVFANISVIIGCILLVILDHRYDSYLKESATPDKVKWRDLLHLPIIFWVLVISCSFFYGSVLSFIGFAPSYISTKWNMSSVVAGRITSAFYITSGIGMPIVGIAIDRVAHRATWMTIGAVLPIVGYAVLIFSDVHPLIGCIILGISYCIAPGAYWPSVPLIVPSKIVGTAYGIMTCLCNFGMFIVPIICGAVKTHVDKHGSDIDNKHILNSMEMFTLFIFSLATFLLTFMVWIVDIKNGAILETTKILKLK